MGEGLRGWDIFSECVRRDLNRRSHHPKKGSHRIDAQISVDDLGLDLHGKGDGKVCCLCGVQRDDEDEDAAEQRNALRVLRVRVLAFGWRCP